MLIEPVHGNDMPRFPIHLYSKNNIDSVSLFTFSVPQWEAEKVNIILIVKLD